MRTIKVPGPGLGFGGSPAIIQTGATIKDAPSRLGALTAADDAQLMLLCCVLFDASLLHLAATDACPGCRALGGNLCSERCWNLHEEPLSHYGELRHALEGYLGTAEAVAYPLTARDRETLAAALPEAITFRQQRDRPEDSALLAAYCKLAAGTESR